jgi:hypothetical protein
MPREPEVTALACMPVRHSKGGAPPNVASAEVAPSSKTSFECTPGASTQYSGEVTVWMVGFATTRKASAQSVAFAILAGIEAGHEDVYPDSFALKFGRQICSVCCGSRRLLLLTPRFDSAANAAWNWTRMASAKTKTTSRTSGKSLSAIERLIHAEPVIYLAKRASRAGTSAASSRAK